MTTIDITKPCTMPDGRPMRDVVRYTSASGPRIAGVVQNRDGTEYLYSWPEDNCPLIQAPEVVEVTVYYYRKSTEGIFPSPNFTDRFPLFAKRVHRVTEGEGL